MTHRITFDDMIAGLEEWRGRYVALDVFADDVEELRSTDEVDGLTEVGGNPPEFALSRRGRTYRIVLFEKQGVLRLELPSDALVAPSRRLALAGLAGPAIAAALSKKGRGAELDLLLGLLVGASRDGNAPTDAPRRSFTMEFDRASRSWLAYTGGLMNWMTRELMPA